MSCSKNPPPPQGYSVWKGSVPGPLQDWAVELLGQSSKFSYGTMWSKDYAGFQLPVIARLDFHTWHIDKKTGKLLTNLCWKGITIYKPIPSGPIDLVQQVYDPTQSPPDPTLAVYDNAPVATNWGLVALTGGVIVATLVAFAAAIRYAGPPRSVARLRRAA